MRRALPVVVSATLLLSAALAAFAVPAAAANVWTPQRHIPGTTGLANPVAATASDGTSVVVWDLGTTHGRNEVHARVRLAGHTTWRDVPVQVSGPFLESVVVIPASNGDFWMAYQQTTAHHGQQVFVSRLDLSARRWSTPQAVFDPSGYEHASPSIARTGDGTLVVAAYATPAVQPPSGDPIYRVIAATKAPGGSWHAHYLSPNHQYAGGPEVAVNGRGDIVISFIRGYHPAQFTVRAATKAHGANTPWRIHTLSAAGDGASAHATIDSHGTAAVVWTDNVTKMTVRLSTTHAEAAQPVWVRRDVVTDGSAFTVEPHVVIARPGHTTVVWRRSTGPEVTLWARTLAHGSFDTAVQLSANGQVAEFDGLRARPDGKAAVLYQEFTPTISSLGLRFRTLTDSTPGTEQQLTGDAATDGDSNSEYLGIDGHSRATVIYTRGSYPDTDFVWQGQVPASP